MIFNREHILSMWRACQITGGREAVFARVAEQLMSYKALYDVVAAETKIPFYVIGAIDCREENFEHNAYLGNGDPLWRKTVHVPKNRGPFKTWIEGAIDALKCDGMDLLPDGSHWDLVTALTKCEAYNGLGYCHMGLPSPYVWGGTNQQRPGKYVEDGHFDPMAWDKQPGVAGIFLTLKTRYGVDLGEA